MSNWCNWVKTNAEPRQWQWLSLAGHRTTWDLNVLAVRSLWGVNAPSMWLHAPSQESRQVEERETEAAASGDARAAQWIQTPERPVSLHICRLFIIKKYTTCLPH